MSMDRETKIEFGRFDGTQNSSNICNNRYAWVGIYLPAAFAGTTISYQVRNEIDEVYRPAKDTDGAPMPPVPVAGGDFIPVPQELSFAANWRFVSDANETADLEFKTANKT